MSVEMSHVKLDKIEGLFDKANAVKDAISLIHREHSLTRVYVEENMQAFRPGASSAQTLVKLAKFNGIVSYLAQQVTGTAPVNVNVNHARKALGIDLKREKVCGIPTKEQVHTWVRQHPLLRDYVWPTRVISSGARKGVEVLEAHVFDMSDAFVIALSGPLVSSEQSED